MTFSNNQPLDGGNIPISSVYRKEDNTFPALAAEPGAYQDSFSNASSAAVMSFLRPLYVQKKSAASGSGAKTLTCTFDNATQPGNSIVVVMGMGEVEAAGITLAITDSQSNTYVQSTKSSQSTTLESAIFLSTGPASGGGIVGGVDTITATIAGGSSSNTAIAMEIYEIWGLISFAGALDQTATGNAASGTAVSTAAVTPVLPNELFFMAISAAGGTITAGANWTLDSGTLAPTGGNLGSFGAQSRPHSTLAAVTPTATLGTSNAWAACCATFKSISVPIQGSVTELNSAAIKADLDTIVTNTNKIPASPAQEGGNLATLAGIVSSSKAATKAAAGDIVDLATLLTLAGAPGDTNTVASFMGRFTKIRDLLAATLAVSAASLPLPSNAAQETGGNLATVAGAVRAEDAASADGNTGIGLLAVRKASPANTSGTDGDYEFLQLSAGRLWVSALIDTALPTGSNVIGALSANQTINNAQVAGTTVDTNSGNKSAGTQRVVIATDQPTMTNAQPVSQNGTWTVQPGNTANTTPWLFSPQVASGGGSVPYHNLSAATTNFTNVKGAAAQMYSCRFSNTSASTINIKVYDKATAPGTGDVPKTTIQMPANTIVLGAFPEGMKFANGFGWAATGGVADNDNTAIGANCIIDFSLNS